MTNSAIHTEHLTLDFGELHAVDDINIDVPGGIVYGLLGSNGAGKTTMIRLLLGLLEPTVGKAMVLGLDTRTQSDEIRKLAGVVMERDDLYQNLTAWENLDYAGRMWKMNTRNRTVRGRELLTSLDLWDRRDEVIGRWSRGMKRRLVIARALIHRPRLLFMDEPTAGLDAMARATVHNNLLTLTKDEGLTVFLTTHKLSEAERLCAMVGVVRDGRLLMTGSTDELRAMGNVPTLEIIGSGFTDDVISLLARRNEIGAIQVQPNRLIVQLLDSGAHSSPLVSLLVESGADVEEVHRSAASLESVFITMMGDEQNRLHSIKAAEG